MAAPVPRLITPGVIAEETGSAIHRVINILNTRPHIRPAARAGTLRLYPRDAIALVRHELNAQDAKRCQRQELAHA